MKWFSFVTGVLLTMLVASPTYAQQPGTSTDPSHPAAPAPGSHGAGMPMMDMCRQMMGDATGMPMMGAGAAADPKEKAEMMPMRGEMMTKHAGHMRGPTPK